jgi:hypothetical protein
MYLTTLKDCFHSTTSGFISISMKDVELHLAKHLNNWDCEYTEEEFESIIKNMHGLADQMSKRYVEVWIKKIKSGETFDI